MLGSVYYSFEPTVLKFPTTKLVKVFWECSYWKFFEINFLSIYIVNKKTFQHGFIFWNTIYIVGLIALPINCMLGTIGNCEYDTSHTENYALPFKVCRVDDHQVHTIHAVLPHDRTIKNDAYCCCATHFIFYS